MREILRRVMLLAACLFFGLLGWGGYYVCNHGFSRHWRVRVSQEFRRRGMDLYVHRLTLDPIQGFVAREVQINDANDASKVLATIDRVDLDINFTNLLHSRPFLDAVDLRNADLSLPVDPDDPQSERIKVSQLNARIIFPQHEWYVSEAEAMAYGVQVSAHGRLQNPEAFHTGGETEENRPETGRPQMALDFLRELAALHYESGPPRVEITFGGDLAEPGSIYADGTVWAEGVKRGASELTQVYAALALRHNVIELKQCNVMDAHGEMDVSGSYDVDKGRGAVELRSTLGPGNLARLLKLDKPMDGWVFDVPPEIELSGAGTSGGKQPGLAGLITGHATLGGFSVKGTGFTGGGADFSWDGKSWYVRNGWLANRTGRAAVRALSAPGSFHAHIESDMNPNSLSGLLSGAASDAMRDWDFQEAPKVALDVTGTSANPADWRTEGSVGLGRTVMRGVPMDWARADVEARGLLFTYRDFDIERDEGGATGTFSYDFGKHEAWLTNVHARLNTTEAAVWINPDLPRQLAPYRFKTAPDVTLNGFVQCANDKGTHLDVHVDAAGGMDYTFCRKDLSFPGISGDVLFREHEIMLKDVTARLCDGAVHGSADIKLGAQPGYTADVEVGQMDFASLTKLYFNYASSHGLLNGAFYFGGTSDDPWTLYGKGAVEITNGNVFAIPVLGPFSGILNSMVPGMGYNLARDGTCSFTVRDGAIATNDLLVKGLGFSMIGDGRLLFLDDRLNFNIRLNAQGLPGVLLFPVSKLLEYAGTGTLENPVWKPVLLEARGRN